MCCFCFELLLCMCLCLSCTHKKEISLTSKKANFLYIDYESTKKKIVLIFLKKSWSENVHLGMPYESGIAHIIYLLFICLIFLYTACHSEFL